MKRIVYQIDAFTKERFTGNPAGVVLNAEGLTVQQMQALARELNNSETAFVISESESDSDARIRYFTPTSEVPVCGHATIASGYAIWKEKLDFPNPVRIKTGAGILSVERFELVDSCRVSMVQGAVKLGGSFEERLVDRIITALGLTRTDLDERCPVSIASTGHSKVMIGIKNKLTLDSVLPDLVTLKALSQEINCNGFYLFTFDSNEEGVLVSGRMFAPAIGIAEDPVTGNANGPLGAYLVGNNLVPHNGSTFSFRGKQGEAIGRKGYVEVLVLITTEGKPEKVTITGDAVDVFRTEIDI